MSLIIILIQLFAALPDSLKKQFPSWTSVCEFMAVWRAYNSKLLLRCPNGHVGKTLRHCEGVDCQAFFCTQCTIGDDMIPCEHVGPMEWAGAYESDGIEPSAGFVCYQHADIRCGECYVCIAGGYDRYSEDNSEYEPEDDSEDEYDQLYDIEYDEIVYDGHGGYTFIPGCVQYNPDYELYELNSDDDESPDESSDESSDESDINEELSLAALLSLFMCYDPIQLLLAYMEPFQHLNSRPHGLGLKCTKCSMFLLPNSACMTTEVDYCDNYYCNNCHHGTPVFQVEVDRDYDSDTPITEPRCQQCAKYWLYGHHVCCQDRLNRQPCTCYKCCDHFYDGCDCDIEVSSFFLSVDP